MISAKEAHDKSKYHATILNLQKEIEEKIIETTEKGKLNCEVSIRVDTPKYVRLTIHDWLEELGYVVEVPEKIDQTGVPCDQATYWQKIKIYWNIVEED